MSMDNMRMVLTASRSTDWLEVICRSTPFRCLTDSHPPSETNLLGVTGKSSGKRSTCLLRKTPPTTRICGTQGITCFSLSNRRTENHKKINRSDRCKKPDPAPFCRQNRRPFAGPNRKRRRSRPGPSRPEGGISRETAPRLSLLRPDAPVLPAFQDQGHRSVVGEGHLHHRPEYAGFHLHPVASEQLVEPVVQP